MFLLLLLLLLCGKIEMRRCCIRNNFFVYRRILIFRRLDNVLNKMPKLDPPCAAATAAVVL